MQQQPDHQPYGEADNPPDDPPARWMTFAELAKSRGISKLSAAALVRRHGWRRQRDNRGHVIAPVPVDGPGLRREADDQPDDEADNPADIPFHAKALAALEDALAALREELGQANARADRAETQTDRLRAQIDELKAGQALMQDMHARELAVARHDAQAAQQDAAELRQADDDNLIHNERVKARVQLGMTVAGGLFVVAFAAPLIAWTANQSDKLTTALAAAAIFLGMPVTLFVNWMTLRELRNLRGRGWRRDEARKARGRWARLRAAWRGEQGSP